MASGEVQVKTVLVQTIQNRQFNTDNTVNTDNTINIVDALDNTVNTDNRNHTVDALHRNQINSHHLTRLRKKCISS